MFWMGNEENNFPLGTLIWGPDKDIFAESKVQISQTLERKIENSFLSISLNICFGCSLRWFFLIPTTYVLDEK